MDTYYSYQDVKRNIAHRLMMMDGWKVYGFSERETDPYTDYYCEAYWSGLATKNGYTLVVDCSSEAAEYRRTYQRETAPELSAEIREKIAKLEQMTQARGASAQEEETARAKIEELQKRADSVTETVEEYTPGHKANPPRCNWHIEKDGIIYDKGSGLLKFANCPDISGSGYGWEITEWQKFNNMSRDEWITDYLKRDIYGRMPSTEEAEHRYNESVEKYALLDKFNELLSRWDSICGGTVGNSGEPGYIYKEVTKTEYKRVLEFHETTNGAFVDGQCFYVKGNFTYGCSGNWYRLTASKSDAGLLYAYKVSKKTGKLCTGSADASNCFGVYVADNATSDRYGRDKEQFNKWIENGAITWGNVEETKKPFEVKKTVKVKVEDENAENTENTESGDTSAQGDYTISTETDTRDNSIIYVVRLNNKVDADTFARIRADFKTHGGYYSRFKKGFIFKDEESAQTAAGITADNDLSIIDQAYAIYKECADMNLFDYADELPADLEYLASLIKEYGYQAALNKCRELCGIEA